MRRIFVKFHLWLGLVIGFLWAIQGLTGALYVFARDYERISMPRVAHGRPASLDDVVAAARRLSGDAVIERLAVTDRHRDLIDVYYHDRAGGLLSAQVDASSGKLVGQRPLEPSAPWSGSFTRWIYVVHMCLNAGRAGEILIAVSGLLLVSSAIMGLWLGWPRKRNWAASFSFRRWKSIDQKLYGWHRAVGIPAGFALVVMGLTGAYMNLGEGLNSVLPRLVPFHTVVGGMHHVVHTGPGHSMSHWPVSAQDALGIAERRMPEAHWVRVFMPLPGKPFYSVRLHEPGETRAWLGATSVVVDAHSGAILDVYDATTAPLANRIVDALFSVHNGEIAGLPGRIAVMLAGLSLPFFYITGVMAWIRRRSRRKGRGSRVAKPRPKPELPENQAMTRNSPTMPPSI